MTDYVIYNGELYHHGVPGMKWGVRKSYDYDPDEYTGGNSRGKKLKTIARDEPDEFDRIMRARGNKLITEIKYEGYQHDDYDWNSWNRTSLSDIMDAFNEYKRLDDWD